MEKVERIFYIAECSRCDMKVPFRTADERQVWADEHSKSHAQWDGSPLSISFYIQPRGED